MYNTWQSEYFEVIVRHLCGMVCTEQQILCLDVHACNFIYSAVHCYDRKKQESD